MSTNSKNSKKYILAALYFEYEEIEETIILSNLISFNSHLLLSYLPQLKTFVYNSADLNLTNIVKLLNSKNCKIIIIK